MATLGAQNHVRSSFLEFVNTAVSVVLLCLLLGAGWIALSYLKSGLHGHFQKTRAEAAVQDASVAPLEAPAAPVLVYELSGDNSYYHTSGHLASITGRSAISEDAAKKRGLKPCPICMRQ